MRLPKWVLKPDMVTSESMITEDLTEVTVKSEEVRSGVVVLRSVTSNEKILPLNIYFITHSKNRPH